MLNYQRVNSTHIQIGPIYPVSLVQSSSILSILSIYLSICLTICLPNYLSLSLSLALSISMHRIPWHFVPALWRKHWHNMTWYMMNVVLKLKKTNIPWSRNWPHLKQSPTSDTWCGFRRGRWDSWDSWDRWDRWDRWDLGGREVRSMAC